MTATPKQIFDALLRHKNVLLYGPPGTGKSHLMSEVAHLFESQVAGNGEVTVTVDEGEERQPFEDARSKAFETRWVTFHQGYSYEDFVVGMRPRVSDIGGFYLEPKPGVLLELAAAAKRGASLLLIDEINRGNTAKIFGEFITLMEPAKRLAEDGSATGETVKIRLPYLGRDDTMRIAVGDSFEEIDRDFSMPAEVYVLASMNSVDKSVAPIDTALRRRFFIINVAPDAVDLGAAVGLSAMPTAVELRAKAGSAQAVAGTAALAIERINQGISLFLGPEFLLGQWYLPKLAAMAEGDAKIALAETWLYKIVPQLLELFHGRADQLVATIGAPNLGMPGSGVAVVEPGDDEVDLGAAAFARPLSAPPGEDEVLSFLQAVAGISAP